MKHNSMETRNRVCALFKKYSIILFIIGIIVAGTILFLNQDSIELQSRKSIQNVEKNITFIIERAEPVFEKIENSISKL